MESFTPSLLLLSFLGLRLGPIFTEPRTEYQGDVAIWKTGPSSENPPR